MLRYSAAILKFITAGRATTLPYFYVIQLNQRAWITHS